jgi:hypothetical protein
MRRREPKRQLGAADAAARSRGRGAQFRSLAEQVAARGPQQRAGRQSRAPRPAPGSAPRTSTAGRSPRRPAPMHQAPRRPPVRSASATSVICELARPNRSRRADAVRALAGNPLQPSAMPTVPLRQARPALSLMTTPDACTPAHSRQRALAQLPRALASGSSGSSSTWSTTSTSSCSRLERHRRPRWPCTIAEAVLDDQNAPGRWRSTARDSREDRPRSRRGSLPARPGRARGRAPRAPPSPRSGRT